MKTISRVWEAVHGLITEYRLIARLNIDGVLNPSPPSQYQIGTNGDVLVVLGFNESWNFFRYLSTHLNHAGYRIHFVPEIGRGTKPIAEEAACVERYIRSNHLSDIVLLSHSKGGLVAKYLLDHSSFARVIRLSVSLSAPYSGTFLGCLQVFNLDELCPRSRFLRREKTLVSNNHRILQLRARLDNHVLPNASLILPRGRNVLLDCIGHTRILEERQSLQIILNELGVIY